MEIEEAEVGALVVMSRDSDFYNKSFNNPDDSVVGEIIEIDKANLVPANSGYDSILPIAVAWEHKGLTNSYGLLDLVRL